MFLSDDVAMTEPWLDRAKRLLAGTATIAVSPEGADGPGVYGLNRNVTLTTVVGKDH